MPALNTERYSFVVVEYRHAPKLIESEAEYGQAKAALERLLFPERRLPVEEDAYAKLLLHLIDDYETRAFPTHDVPPRRLLRHLMDQRGLKQADLIPVFGAVSIVSEVLSGKRQINAKHARRLAGFFGVSADLFV